MADPVIGDVVPPTGLDMPIPVTPQELLTPQKFVFSPGANDPDDVKMAKLEAKIKELEAVISSFNSWIPALMAGQQKPKEFSPEKIENEDTIKPMHPKDMKPPPEFSGNGAISCHGTRASLPC